MANNMTYATALVSIRDFAVSNGFDNEEVINKINKLVAQKSRTSATAKKSKARIENERLANDIIAVMHENNISVIDNKWVRDNIFEIASPARATAVLNVACDLKLLERHIEAKSATRNVCTYTIC